MKLGNQGAISEQHRFVQSHGWRLEAVKQYWFNFIQ